MSLVEMIQRFSIEFGVPVCETPGWPPTEVVAERLAMIREEWGELTRAVDAHDLVAVADALADLLYVVAGTAPVLGINMQPILAEVHRANMSKTPGTVPHAKGVKGPGYRPPQVRKALAAQGWRPKEE